MTTNPLKKLNGIYPSFLTPLRPDETLDVDGVDREVDYLLQAGVHGIWLAGTGGEIFGISEETLRQMVRRVAKRVNGRVPVMANISACATALSIDRARFYAECGVDVASCTPPFYFSYTINHAVDYYRQIAHQSPLPVIIYNNPFVGNRIDMTPEIVKTLCREPNIIGIKDCCGSAGRIEALLQIRQEAGRADFLVYESWEPFTTTSLQCGADGAIMSAATVLPKLCVQLYEHCLSGKFAKATILQKQVNAFLDAFSIDGVFPDDLFIGGTKACLELLGICSRTTVHPIRPWPKEKDEQFCQMLTAQGILPLENSCEETGSQKK